MTGADAVLAANRRFYAAFEALDLGAMDEIWAHDGLVTCAHPGWPLAHGWPAVRRTWQTIFRNTDSILFEIRDPHVDVSGDLAWVVCVEHIRSEGGRGAVLATNVFRRVDGAWRMAHHHGGPVAVTPDEADGPDEPPTGALN